MAWDIAGHMADIARLVLGPPNARLSTAAQLRFGKQGSVAVEIAGADAGAWFDHENKIGGGPWDFLREKAGLVDGAATAWLHSELGIGKPPKGKSRIVAIYDYHDESGELMYQQCRYDPKDFRQRRPDGMGGWLWSTKGVRQVPYRLPELIEARGDRVFIAEAEKDCDALASWGLFATCNAGGAGKWRPDYAQYFTDTDAVVIADNDEAGQAHARAVAVNIASVARSVRILDLPGLPPKGDFSDWAAAGGSLPQLEDLIAGAREFRHEPQMAGPNPIVDAGEDEAAIPPRGWLLGNAMCRRFISGNVAQGGVGKTALAHVRALALATGRPLTGEHVFQRCRVLIVSLEDDIDELRRRVRAARTHHRITAGDVRGWLFLWTPIGLKIAEQKDGSRAVVPGELEQQLRAVIAERQIDVVEIDPLVKAHTADENDNNALDGVAIILARLATDMNCAVDLPQHERKSGTAEPGDANRARGASSYRDAARLLYTITPMTDVEREQFGLTEAERRSLIRVDSAKVNIAPPSIEARWFRIVGVPLGNGTDLYPHGDEVPTVEPWTPPDIWAEISISAANEILDRIDAALADGRRYSAAPQAGEARAVWRVVQSKFPNLSEKQCRNVIATWVKSGVLITDDYDDPIQRRKSTGLFVAKRPG